ncbi:YlbF family regulator [Bacillus massilinigeriensis]|uniref:YlbF family regulator n=1 Tax=Bacillus mediterraneensis TaxID=1805474 RepID=UPI0008F87125|nr:YlbF family regulator [Bacillus mediterraneensis]
MAVNLYDSANEMGKAIRESAEFTSLKRLFDEVNNDESARQTFEDFRNIQMHLQQKQMTGQEITEQEVQQAQQLVAVVQSHPKISELMKAEQHLSMVIAELNQIIMKPLEELYGNPQQQ